MYDTENRLPGEKTVQELGIWFTNDCNLRCTYCYIQHKTPRTIPIERAMEIIAPCLDSPGIPVDILPMGAEPLTHFPELRRLVETVSARTWQRKYHFFASTNGTLLDDEMRAWFTAHRDVITLGLSYDGSDSDQDQNRGGSASRIDKDFFLENWPKQPWKMTISRETAPTVDRGIIALHERGVPFTANPAQEAEPWPEETILQYELALFRLADYYAAHPEIAPCNMLSLLPEPLSAPEETPQDAACGAGYSLFFYDMEGNAYPCHMLSTLVLPAEQAITGTCFAEGTDFSDPRCRACPLKLDCYSCLGSNYVYRGDIRLRDPLHCRLYQASIRATMHMWIGRLRGRGGYTAREREIIATLQALQKAFDSGKTGMK